LWPDSTRSGYWAGMALARFDATAAIAVNSIPKVLNAPPGLHSMADLPVPTAMLADARHFLPEELVEVRYD